MAELERVLKGKGSMAAIIALPAMRQRGRLRGQDKGTGMWSFILIVQEEQKVGETQQEVVDSFPFSSVIKN